MIAADPKRPFTAQSLPSHPLFEQLSGRHRHILAECSMQASFTAGDMVAETGKPANCFHLVVSGSIALEACGDRSPTRVQVIGPGDILGWSWFFPPYYWHFNAVAEEPTETIFFYGSRLSQECDRNHDLGYELFKRMAQILVGRLQTTREKWIEAAQYCPARYGVPSDYLII